MMDRLAELVGRACRNENKLIKNKILILSDEREEKLIDML